MCRPYLWGEAGRELERERQRVGWLQWERPGTRQVLESLDQHRMTLSLHHFPQLAPLEVRATAISVRTYSTLLSIHTLLYYELVHVIVLRFPLCVCFTVCFVQLSLTLS